MRILWLSSRDPKHPQAGGAEETIHALGSRFARRGHSFCLVCERWRGSSDQDYIDGISVLRLAPSTFIHETVPLFLASQPDIDVIVDDLAHLVPWFSPWFTRRPVTAFFHHLHSRTLSGQVPRELVKPLVWLESLYPRVYRNCSFVTESVTSASDLSSLGISSNRITMIRPGVDETVFYPRTKSPTPELVYFSGLRRYKRPELAIRVIELLRHAGRDAHLTVIGQGSESDSLRKVVARRGMEKHVDFSGRVSRMELGQLVGRAWANLNFSVAEGWGFSISEACVAGVPTVAFSTPGVSQTILDGKTGVLVQDGDLHAFSLAVARILEEPTKWQSSCLLYRTNLTWESTLEGWIRHLSSIVDHGLES